MKALIIISLGLAAVLGVGTWQDPGFWRTADQRGDALMAQKQFGAAAKVYQDPMRLGVAQFRNGGFKEAAATFARVPGADGLYNAATASLMHGAYDKAIGLYDRALRLRPDWKEAADNKALAIARRDSMTIPDEDRNAESADAYDPDNITFDNKGGDQDKEPGDPGSPANDKALQATWLRRVKTTPAQFLKAKFAWQASGATRQGGVP